MSGPPSPVFHASACWVVSDLHLWPNHPWRLAAFHRLLARAVAEQIPVVCGGDLFHLFLGWNGSLLPFQEEIYQKMKEFRKKGLEFYWIEGNRDYRPEFWRDVLAWSGRVLVWQIGSQRIGMRHGEDLDRTTWTNRLWLRVAKHRVVLDLGGRLPGPLVLRMGLYLERWLGRDRAKYRRPIPWHAIGPDLARWARRDRLDLVLLGHYHQWTVRHFEPPTAGEWMVVPAWEDQPTYLEITAAGHRVLRRIDGSEAGIEPLAPEATLAPARPASLERPPR